MPVVKQTEYYPAQLKRAWEKLEASLSLCDDEAQFETWKEETDRSCFEGDEFWSAFVESEIENRKLLINQNKETNLCQ